MFSKLIKISFFELKKNLFYSLDWLSNAIFLLVNIAIFPFTVNPSPAILNQLFLSVIMTSMLLGIVLTTQHVFDEDAEDGSLDQYLSFGLPMHIIYISKVIATSLEFSLILGLAFPFSAIFYSIDFYIISKICFTMLLSIPLISSISVFGSMLTINLHKNSAISILLIFPLLISILISLSLAAEKILSTGYLSNSLAYIEINLGLSVIIIPILCWLSKHLKQSP